MWLQRETLSLASQLLSCLGLRASPRGPWAQASMFFRGALSLASALLVGWDQPTTPSVLELALSIFEACGIRVLNRKLV